jgi:excisionase family DNA binding protein
MTASPTGTHDLAPLLYTVSEVCTVLRMSRTQFYAQVGAGRLATVKQGASTRVTAEDLAAYVKLLKREAEAAK